MNTAQRAFDNVTEALATALEPRYEDVKEVALAIWHEGFVPDVFGAGSLERVRAAGYLVDKFCGYNCIPEQQRKSLNAVKRQLLDTFQGPAVAFSDVEPRAQRWGLCVDLKAQAKRLLEFQTRHYRHESVPVM